MKDNIILLRIISLTLIIIMVFSCKKDGEIISDNNAPYYDGIPTVVIENYINRLFIDLIGREPLDTEMTEELAVLKDADLSISAREELIEKLQMDTNYLPGDSSYKHAYYMRFYEMSKARLLEAVADHEINSEFINRILSTAFADSLAGDSFGLEINNHKVLLLKKVLAIPREYRLDSIGIKDVYSRLLNNAVYDEINMNTFNFLRASFNDLFFRYPTQSEFDKGYSMIEYDQSEILFGVSGQNKGDFISILVNSKEFYEGVVKWLYQTLLAREPSTTEVVGHMETFYVDHDVQKLQRNIMATDEYANFN